ncbi:unnamed protein product, partial [Onchocerca ochengi]|uniref:NAD_binding_9 domain-containing protein n=1 Tax=Onchocerca ochengi TaxID=42157 RepID=A0A182ESF5_ONCOC
MHLLILFIAIVRLVENQKIPKHRSVGIIGAGTTGVSSALALLERDQTLNITIFHDVPFEKSSSYGPAGLFRVDTFQN